MAAQSPETLPQLVWGMVRDTVAALSTDEVATRAAALSFFTMVSLSPMLVLLLYASTLLGFDAQTMLVEQVLVLLGTTAAEAVQEIVGAAKVEPALGQTSAVLSLGAVLLSGTAVFVQLQTTLNRVWQVPPRASFGPVGWFRRRALSVAMLCVLGLLLILSLVATTLVQAWLPGDGWAASLSTEATSAAVVAVAFTLLYRLVPDAVVAWRDAAVGGTTTAVLFGVGKYAIGVWLARSGAASSYGAAGALVLMPVWIYYSAVIVLLGAELTQHWSDTFGAGIVPRDLGRDRHGSRSDRSDGG